MIWTVFWAYQRNAEKTISMNVWLGYQERNDNVMLSYFFILISLLNTYHIKAGLLASAGNRNCVGTLLLSFSRLQSCVNSISVWRQKENCWTKEELFSFFALVIHVVLSLFYQEQNILQTHAGINSTWVSSDEYPIKCCLLSEPDEFTYYVFLAIQMRRPGVRDIVWICDTHT